MEKLLQREQLNDLKKEQIFNFSIILLASLLKTIMGLKLGPT